MNTNFLRFSHFFQIGFCSTAFLGVSGFLGHNVGTALSDTETIINQFTLAGFSAALATCGTQYRGYKRNLGDIFNLQSDLKDNLVTGLGLSLGLNSGLIAGVAIGVLTLNI